MGDISSKIQKFIEIFIDNRGYVKVVEGLKNTVIIAITGLIIGILIGTIIATVRVIPKYKRLPRVLDAICSVYVGFFRGTPMVVQLLLFYYVLLPPGQMEGGRAMGLSFATTMRKIVIPQAVKNILPTLGNEFISLIKETSVVSFVGATDLYVAFNYIGSNSYEFMIPYLVMALIYIVMVLLISLGIKLMERSLRKSDRRH